MEIGRNHNGRWVIIHGGREIAEDFDSEVAAYQWADKHIDDQMFDDPNWFSPPLRYRSQRN